MHGGQFKAQAIWGKAALNTAPSLFHKLSPWLMPMAALAFLALLLLGPGGRFAHGRDKAMPS